MRKLWAIAILLLLSLFLVAFEPLDDEPQPAPTLRVYRARMATVQPVTVVDEPDQEPTVELICGCPVTYQYCEQYWASVPECAYLVNAYDWPTPVPPYDPYPAP